MAKALRKPPSVTQKADGTRPAALAVLVATIAVILACWGNSVISSPAPLSLRGDIPQSVEPSTTSVPSACDAPEPLLCDPWHKAGYCSPRAPGTAEIRKQCPRTCGLCPGDPGRAPQIAHSDRCQRDNKSAAVPAKQLKPLFERVLAEFPQYEPEALSTSPYVLLLKNFLVEEEANAFLSVCHKSFERSLAGDQLNPVRTSYQCWCNFRSCFTNPHVHNVTHRINKLLRIPYNNGEDLQIVRYEPGQFYKQHHDQNTAIWTPQGPRVLTFFMYLNDPESGGETEFPQIGGGLKVQPKLGHAILWPSTLDEEPMKEDRRTVHAAMAVKQGIKYGANMYVPICTLRPTYFGTN